MQAVEEKARAIFLSAVEHHSPDQWSSYLDDTCQQDDRLRSAVERLIRSHQELGSFHESPHAAIAAIIDEDVQPDSVKQRIGPYRIVEEIGVGGMGTVYLAEQKQPVRRTVALKVIKRGMDTEEVVARFEAERQALAMMNHPNIARVLDAGATDDGRPYFVMDLVRGIPITAYCDQHQLNRRERLELFTTVCHAVQHAHQKGVIHRDIKPTNVLVELHDVRHVPKVIDFGVAKATNQRLTERTLVTHYSQMIGTPMYMSPEQAELSGLDVDTRSDVYSLGVLLYELLTGSTPFDRETFKEVSLDEMRRIIRQDQPPRPSHRISTLDAKNLSTVAERQRTDIRGFRRDIEGELDWIVMKCLEKDRMRRYESASALAADVERHLAGVAVEACPPSKLYRLRKFSQRNRAAISTAAAILVVMTAGLAGTTWQAIRAWSAEQDAVAHAAETEEERDQAEKNLGLAKQNLDLALQTVDEMYVDVAQRWVADDVASSEVQIDFLTRAGKFYQQVIDQADAFKLSPAEVAQCHVRIAHVRAELAHEESARKHLERALAVFDKALREAPRDIALQTNAADAYYFLATLHADVGDYVAAEKANKNARNHFKRAADLEKGTAVAGRLGLARTELQRAELLVKLNRLNEAAQFAKSAGDIYCFGNEKLWHHHMMGRSEDPNNPPSDLQLEFDFWRFEVHKDALRKAGEFENFLWCQWLLARIERLLGQVDETNMMWTLLADEMPDVLLGWLDEEDAGGGRQRHILELQLLLLEEKAQISMARGEFDKAVPILRNVLAKRTSMFRGKKHPIHFVDRSHHNMQSLGMGSRKFVQPKAFLDFAATELRLACCLRELGHADDALQIAVKTYHWLSEMQTIVQSPRAQVVEVDAVAEISRAIADRWPEDARIAAQCAAHQWAHMVKSHPSLDTFVSGLYDTQPDLARFVQHFPQYDFVKQGDAVLGEFQSNYWETDSWIEKVETYAFAAMDARHPANPRDLTLTVNDLRKVLRQQDNGDEMAWLHLALAYAKQGKVVRAKETHAEALTLVADAGAASKEFSELEREVWRLVSFGPNANVGNKDAGVDDVGSVDTLVAPRSGGLSAPRGIEIGPDGKLYISRMNRHTVAVQQGNVNRYDAQTGDYLGVFATHSSLTGAKDIEFGPDGNLYVSNNLDDNIFRFDGATGEFIDIFVSAGSGGLDTPRTLVFGPDGNFDGRRDLYVASAKTDSILRYSGATGAFIDEFVAPRSGGLISPTAIVFGPDGDLFVASGAHQQLYNRILRFDGESGEFKKVFVESGSGGLTLAPTAGIIFGPDVNGDAAADLYVSNAKSDTLLVFDGHSGAFVTVFARANLGGLDGPTGLVFDTAGNLLVVNSGDFSVKRFGRLPPTAFTDSQRHPDEKTDAVAPGAQHETPTGIGRHE